MRKLSVTEFLSLDGVMQGPGDPDEDRSGGFAHGGWHRPYVDDVFMKSASEGMAETGGFLFGRKTYEVMAAFWPSQPDSDPFVAVLNGLPKHVASTTLREPLEWKGSTLLQGDVPAAVAALKEQPGGDLVVLGSGELVRTLMEHDLVDEFRLMIDPIVLGGGKRLFPEEGPVRPLRLVNSTTSGTGMLITTYVPE
ncbi:MAG TPA: dihydrofolate reductase family protein [Actinomycetota bacterium]|nr:dihydrofolate reductase family protein [Actinomycetota bacterium]